MLLRPETLGIIGLAIGGIAALALWLRRPDGPASVRPAVCIHCGTLQHNLSRTAALAHEVVGSDTCVACGEKLHRGR